MKFDVDLFKEFVIKTDLLNEEFGECLDPRDFYLELFNNGAELQSRDGDHDGKGNVIVISKANHGEGKEKRYTIHADNRFEDLTKISDDEFAFMSPISYFGKNRTLKNARQMYALTFDLDYVGEKQIGNLFAQIQNDVIPRPTYIANSGGGLHLYYKFEVPIPMYPAMQKALKELKDALTTLIWNVMTSKSRQRQYQSINQGFRIVGGQTKALITAEMNFDNSNNVDGVKTTATVNVWRSGIPITLTELSRKIKTVLDIDWDNVGKYNPNYTLEEAKEKFPEWYQKRIIEKQLPGQWDIKRDLFDWYKKKIVGGAIPGHRYWCLYALSAFAVKCGIEFEELEKEAIDLQPILDVKGKEPFTVKDMKDALKLYNDPELATRLTRRYLEEQTAIPMPANKRNYRPQEIHMQIARATRDIIHENWREGNGRKNKREIVQNWRFEHPDGRKVDCIRETGLSKPTVLKWWDVE